jgi:hypothetical protein
VSLGDPPNYAPAPGELIGELAKACKVTSDEIAYELLLADEGRATLYLPASNFAGANPHCLAR